MENNKLEQLYSLRKNFTIIGLTGRTGSGCSELANVMSSSFSNAVNIRNPKDIEETVFQRKYKIVYNYTELNWKKYKVIEYKKVLFLLLLPELYKNPDNTILFDYYRFRLKDEPTKEKIDKLKNEIKEFLIVRNH